MCMCCAMRGSFPLRLVQYCTLNRLAGISGPLHDPGGNSQPQSDAAVLLLCCLMLLYTVRPKEGRSECGLYPGFFNYSSSSDDLPQYHKSFFQWEVSPWGMTSTTEEDRKFIRPLFGVTFECPSPIFPHLWPPQFFARSTHHFVTPSSPTFETHCKPSLTLVRDRNLSIERDFSTWCCRGFRA